MQEDCITVKLRLQGLAVLEVKEAPTGIEVVARYKDNEAICPRCERSTWQVHQWSASGGQRKRDAKLWGKEVWTPTLPAHCPDAHKVAPGDPELLTLPHYQRPRRGKHNRIKTMKRRAYGYRNDRSFLLRLLSRIHTD